MRNASEHLGSWNLSQSGDRPTGNGIPCASRQIRHPSFLKEECFDGHQAWREHGWINLALVFSVEILLRVGFVVVWSDLNSGLIRTSSLMSAIRRTRARISVVEAIAARSRHSAARRRHCKECFRRNRTGTRRSSFRAGALASLSRRLAKDGAGDGTKLGCRARFARFKSRRPASNRRKGGAEVPPSGVVVRCPVAARRGQCRG